MYNLRTQKAHVPYEKQHDNSEAPPLRDHTSIKAALRQPFSNTFPFLLFM